MALDLQDWMECSLDEELNVKMFSVPKISNSQIIPSKVNWLGYPVIMNPPYMYVTFSVASGAHPLRAFFFN